MSINYELHFSFELWIYLGYTWLEFGVGGGAGIFERAYTTPIFQRHPLQKVFPISREQLFQLTNTFGKGFIQIREKCDKAHH